MGQHRLNSLAIIYIEHAYGNLVIVNSMDKIFDIFLQHHGRKNFFFEHGLDNVENVDRIILHMQTFNRAIFPMITVSLDGKMVNVGVSNSISTPTLSGKKVTAPAPPPPPPPKSVGAHYAYVSILSAEDARRYELQIILWSSFTEK